MPLDPQAQQILDEAKAAGLPPVYFLSVEKARERLTAAFSTKGTPEAVHRVENQVIPGPNPIPIRVYIPNASKNLPVVVFFHGGGWVVNNLETHDGLCRSFTNSTQCIFVSVDYRLAPENKYPAAIEDAYRATDWISHNVSKFGGDPGRMAVGGDSSGGTQALIVSLLARDRGGPKIAFQWAAYPPTDYYLPGTASYRELATGYSMNRDWMIWFWNHYLPNNIDLDDPYICPLRAKDFSNLPPALIMTAEYDPLRDEGESYAEKLKQASVPVKLKRLDGLMHGFLMQRARIDRAQKAFEEITFEIRHTFGLQ